NADVFQQSGEPERRISQILEHSHKHYCSPPAPVATAPRCHGVNQRRNRTSRKSANSATSSVSTIPLTISPGNPRENPSVNSTPRPPTPISAPTLTRLILLAEATRVPAVNTGTASGSSTAKNRRAGR